MLKKLTCTRSRCKDISQLSIIITSLMVFFIIAYLFKQQALYSYIIISFLRKKMNVHKMMPQYSYKQNMLTKYIYNTDMFK